MGPSCSPSNWYVIPEHALTPSQFSASLTLSMSDHGGLKIVEKKKEDINITKAQVRGEPPGEESRGGVAPSNLYPEPTVAEGPK